MDTLEFQQKVLDFLKKKKCISLPESSIERYEKQFILFARQYIEYGSSGLRMDEEMEQKFNRLIKEIGALKRNIVSSCFPDYIWPDDIKEIIEKSERFALLNIKQEMESVFISRDKKQALSMIPFLEHGGVFAVVGFGHLNGVIKELQAQGWEVEPIELSRPLEPVDCPSGPSNSENSDLPPAETPSDDDSSYSNTIGIYKKSF